MTEPTPTAAPIADATAAPETPAISPSETLANLSSTDRATWRETGKLPDAAPVVAQADGDSGDETDVGETAPAVPAPAVPVPAAASNAGKVLNAKKLTQQQKINELARENYLLKGELAGVRSTTAPRPAAEPAPAAAAPAASRGQIGDPDVPVVDDFETYADYTRAVARYEIRQAQQADRAERAQAQGQAQYAEVARAHDTRVDAFIATHPDYLEVVSTQTAVMPTPLLAQAVLHSALAPEIAYHLNTHLDEYRALVSLPPGPMLTALGRLEARLDAASPAAVAPVPAKHVTTAPAPPVTLGSRPALPADDAKSAVARGDFAAYRASQNAREIAARR